MKGVILRKYIQHQFTSFFRSRHTADVYMRVTHMVMCSVHTCLVHDKLILSFLRTTSAYRSAQVPRLAEEVWLYGSWAHATSNSIRIFYCPETYTSHTQKNCTKTNMYQEINVETEIPGKSLYISAPNIHYWLVRCTHANHIIARTHNQRTSNRRRKYNIQERRRGKHINTEQETTWTNPNVQIKIACQSNVFEATSSNLVRVLWREIYEVANTCFCATMPSCHSTHSFLHCIYYLRIKC